MGEDYFFSSIYQGILIGSGTYSGEKYAVLHEVQCDPGNPEAAGQFKTFTKEYTMTTLCRKNIRCSVCGTETEQTEIVSTNTFGSLDLDTRPPGGKRFTIHTWVQRCSGCGACAGDLSKANACAGEVVKKQDYLTQLRDSEYPELANSFICESMIYEHGGELAPATWSLIHAAWACDDVKSTSQAMTCRRRAATMLRKELSAQKQPGESTLILVDLLRRAGELEEAAELIEKGRESFSEEVFRQVADFQKGLVQAGDLGCYTIAEALGDDSHPVADASSAGERNPGIAKRWWQFWKLF